MVYFIEQLNDELMLGIESYLEDQNKMDEIKFSIFFVCVFVVFVIFWTPYLIKLRKKIWSTKGMLNMIPIEIIFKDINLK